MQIAVTMEFLILFSSLPASNSFFTCTATDCELRPHVVSQWSPNFKHIILVPESANYEDLRTAYCHHNGQELAHHRSQPSHTQIWVHYLRLFIRKHYSNNWGWQLTMVVICQPTGNKTQTGGFSWLNCKDNVSLLLSWGGRQHLCVPVIHMLV